MNTSMPVQSSGFDPTRTIQTSNGPGLGIYSSTPQPRGEAASFAGRPSLPQMAATFSEIRAACQSAQSRIMRLQQATNNQVGLTSTIREGWFEELRHVAQCFITAQQVSAKLERAINTERAQLQGSLSAALSERDLRTSERNVAEQEVKVLHSRLSELLNRMPRTRVGTASLQHPQFNPHVISGSWSSAGEESGASWYGDSPEMDKYLDSSASMDIFKQLPTAVEDMPFSPQKKNGHSGPPSNNTSSSSEAEHKDGHTRRLRTNENTPHFANGGHQNSQSKFFGKNGGTLAQRGYNSYTEGSGQSTPEFGNRPGSSRFSQTPGIGLQGPFTPPLLPQQRTHSVPPPGYSPHTHEPADNSGKMLRAQPPGAASQTSQALTSSKELSLFRGELGRSAEFAPSVQAQRGSSDEARVRDIFCFFNAIKSWVDRYCSIPDADAMHSLNHKHPRLWDYACSVTYPNNRHNAASHSLFMLCNKSFRTFFITRLVIQYVVQQMWSPEAWEGLDEKLTDVLVSVKHRLDFTNGYDAVLQPHERHALVEKRSRAIYDFMRQPNWNKCKAQKINQAANRFKDIVGPMMNVEKVDHQGALHELIGICETALRLSAVLNTSRLSFQFIFNECGIKFSEQSHRPLNSTIPTRELQAHHWRLMCVVTPGITYRNDAGVSVDPRFLAKANVLTMQ